MGESYWNTYTNALDDFSHDVTLGLDLLVHSTANDKYNWIGQKEDVLTRRCQNYLWPTWCAFIWVTALFQKYWDYSQNGFTYLLPSLERAFDSNDHRSFWVMLRLCSHILKKWSLMLSASQNVAQRQGS